MVFPENLELFRKASQKYFSEKGEVEIDFSGPTYQVGFPGEKETIWVFVQLTEEGEIKDLFCQCEQSAETGSCVHMAQAILALFPQPPCPLHKQFERSVFYRALSSFVGQEATCCSKGKCFRLGEVSIEGPKELVTSLEKTVCCREEETEETSIKFSNLSEKELEDWYKGVASPRLRFELSQYGDVAKYLFLQDVKEKGRYSIEKKGEGWVLLFMWGENTATIPLQCPLEDILERLPLHRTTPAVEHFGGRQISNVTFDGKTLTVDLTGSLVDLSQAEQVGEQWFLKSTLGFIRKWEQGTQLSLSSTKEITDFIEDFIEEPPPLSLSYAIDVENGLSITPYVKKKGDLEGAIAVDGWLWKEGWHRIEPARFLEPITVSCEGLSDFLLANRHWLSSFPGYAVHERPYREKISYSVEPSGELLLHRKLHDIETSSIVSLGDWVWVEGEGFFLRDGSAKERQERILPYHVADFIRKERESLAEIPGFFAQECPITDVGLDIRLERKRRIDILPVYEWTDSSYREKARFYDDMAYVPGVGFFSLPVLLAQQHFTRTISSSEREEWDRFFTEQLAQLQEEFSCSVDPLLEVPKKLTLFCKDLETDEDQEVSELPHHWQAGFYWESERGRAMAEEVLIAARRGDRFLPTQAGLLDLTDQRFGWLSSIETLKAEKRFSLQVADFLKIQAHETFSFDKTVSETAVSFIDRLLNAQFCVPLDLSGFSATLRPYQQSGVEWLWYLYLAGLSGLLCDDMGVGKTYQAMALMYAVHRRKKGKARFLVVCPTSLFWHWREKCQEVLPELKVFSYVGSDRDLDGFSPEHDLMLTTYGIWRNEAKNLQEVMFEVAIFDELQIAKNHVSQIWTALSQVKANMRLGLTGTPVENQTRELKAIFDLVLPGYFPSEKVFKKFYIAPIEREGASDRRALLARYVRPFILRRRKEDVLPDLPPKVEDIYEAELIGEQKELYRQIASRQGVPIIQQLQEEGAPIPYLHIFALLSSLKQVCNHPASYLHDVENYRRYESGKWNLFEELIEEAMESGQKVVVFSQFLTMLDIFKSFLESNGIGFSEIRGSTKERGKAISTFHDDSNCRVFLGSLQAAGLGIDLTPASIVIHYDRWWNAAREQQATDRVHRLGQNRGVMVYKLMTTKSVEERVDKIIAHKSQLFEDLIRYDDHQIVKKLNRLELLELLQGLESV